MFVLCHSISFTEVTSELGIDEWERCAGRRGPTTPEQGEAGQELRVGLRAGEGWKDL